MIVPRGVILRDASRRLRGVWLLRMRAHCIYDLILRSEATQGVDSRLEGWAKGI